MSHTGIAASNATVLWTQVAVLLSLAWLLGAVARRFGQPPIIGSLLAGLIAGPSVFGHVWPGGFHWFRPGTAVQSGLLGAVSSFSLLVLLIALGAETDLPLIRQLGRPAASVVGGSLLLPLAAGAVVAVALPRTFRGAGSHPTSFVIVLAAAMAVSSLPVIARIMSEMGLTRRNVGQLSIATATVNDVVGFLALALATALVGGGGSTKLLVAIGGLIALVAALATGGQRLVDLALRRSRRHGPDIAAGIGVCAVTAFVAAAIAQALGVDAALGAFLAGIVVGRSRFVARRVLEAIQWLADAVFAPLYFATAGLSVDVGLLGHGSTGLWFLVVLLVALTAKFAGAYAGARLARLPAREGVALGISLNGRGALQVILATAGLSAGILTSSAFTVIILVSLVSSVLVPPLLRRSLHGWTGTDEERARLDHEEQMTTNVVVRGQRLLLPTRGSANSVAAARVLDLAWPASSEVTLLRVADVDEAGLQRVREMLGERPMREEVAVDQDAVAAILAHANLGYGAVAVGAAERPHGDGVLPGFIEQLMNHTPVPLVIVRRGRQVAKSRGYPLIRPRRILVPVTGNAASRAGQEVAETVARNTGADIKLLHVVTRPTADPVDRRPAMAGGRGSAAAAVLDDARRQASDKRLTTDTAVREAAFSGEEIAREAMRIGADLVVLGTTVRRVADRPFLGHTVEHLLEHVSGPTVVAVVLPDAQHAAADEHIDRRTG